MQLVKPFLFFPNSSHCFSLSVSLSLSLSLTLSLFLFPFHCLPFNLSRSTCTSAHASLVVYQVSDLLSTSSYIRLVSITTRNAFVFSGYLRGAWHYLFIVIVTCLPVLLCLCVRVNLKYVWAGRFWACFAIRIIHVVFGGFLNYESLWPWCNKLVLKLWLM